MNFKRGLAVVIGCVIAAAVSLAATWPRFHPAAPASVHASAASGASAAGSAAASAPPPAAPVHSLVAALAPLPSHGRPLAWARLTDAQRIALAPFASEWDHFGTPRKRKWLRIAARYPKLSPDAQKRLHERMTEWVRMTPEQRRVARENYQISKELPPQARRKAWTAYQKLSPEQKARLAATERRRRPTVVSVPPTGKTELRDIDRLVTARARAAAHRAHHKGGYPGGHPALPASVVAAASLPGADASASLPAPASPAAGEAAAPAAPATVVPLLQPDSPTYKGS